MNNEKIRVQSYLVDYNNILFQYAIMLAIYFHLTLSKLNFT